MPVTEGMVAMFVLYERVRHEGKFNMLSAEAAMRMRELQSAAHKAQYGEVTGEGIRAVVENFEELTRIQSILGSSNRRGAPKRKRNPSNLSKAFTTLRRRKYFCRQSFSGDHDGNHMFMSPTAAAKWEKSKRARVHFKGDWDVAKAALQEEGILLTKKRGRAYISTK